MSKKVLSCMLAVAMAATLATVTASADDTQTRGTIYFDSTNMGGEAVASHGTYYCFAWSDREGAIYTWDSIPCKMTNLGDNMYSYDVPAVNSAGDSIKADLMVFHAAGGGMTYDTTFTDACIGDTAYALEEYLTPEQSSMVRTVAWKNNPAQGRHITISATGKVEGWSLLEHETAESVVDEFIAEYKAGMEAGKTGYDNEELVSDAKRAELIAEINAILDEYRVEAPTEAPTAEPTEAPTAEPTEAPTAKPTTAPTQAPTAKPTTAPTNATNATTATTATSKNNSNGSVNTSQNSTLAVLASTLLASFGVVYGIGKKREENN